MALIGRTAASIRNRRTTATQCMEVDVAAPAALHKGTECHPRTEQGRDEEKTGAGTRRTSLLTRHSQEAEGGENHVAAPDIDALKA